MKEKLENWRDLSDAEKARLLARTPIAVDDPDAICTKVGWAKYQEEARVLMVQVGKRVRVLRCAWESCVGKLATVKEIAEGGQVISVEVDGEQGCLGLARADVTVVLE
jgi:hypothetical protein